MNLVNPNTIPELSVNSSNVFANQQLKHKMLTATEEDRPENILKSEAGDSKTSDLLSQSCQWMDP